MTNPDYLTQMCVQIPLVASLLSKVDEVYMKLEGD